MPPPSLNIKPPTHPERLLGRLRVVWVRDRQLAAEDQVRRETRVFVRRVVGVTVGAKGKKCVSWAFVDRMSFLCFHMRHAKQGIQHLR
jgi:hypothetical protein